MSQEESAIVTDSASLKCLITERHDWETGGRQQQLQFILEKAEEFFGSGENQTQIQIRLFLPPGAAPLLTKDITISREYDNATRRTNGFPEMGVFPSSFIFFEEIAEEKNVYDVWWQEDKAIVMAYFRHAQWVQGPNTTYGRGRLSTIVPAPVPRLIDRLE